MMKQQLENSRLNCIRYINDRKILLLVLYQDVLLRLRIVTINGIIVLLHHIILATLPGPGNPTITQKFEFVRGHQTNG